MQTYTQGNSNTSEETLMRGLPHCLIPRILSKVDTYSYYA